MITDTTLDTLLAMAAMLLGLSLVVQVVQEIWKYLSSSEARTYRKVLRDFFGPWVERLYESGPVARLQVRGPFQFIRSSPTGRLLPLKKTELLEAMDMVSGDWFSYLLDALKVERRLQAGGPATPSPLLERAIANLQRGAESEGGPGEHNARRIVDFLRAWGLIEPAEEFGETAVARAYGEPVDAARLIEGIYAEFFPDRLLAERSFDQLARNFEHAYQRRNLRQTFFFALVLCLGLNFPIDRIYARASALSPADAAELATSMVAAHDRIQDLLARREPGDEEGRRERVEQLDAVRRNILTELQRHWSADEPEGNNLLWSALSGRPAHYRAAASIFANCLATALLISFGAPFWHRLSKALLSVRGPKAERLAQEED